MLWGKNWRGNIGEESKLHYRHGVGLDLPGSPEGIPNKGLFLS